MRVIIARNTFISRFGRNKFTSTAMSDRTLSRCDSSASHIAHTNTFLIRIQDALHMCKHM